jgi:dipeptidyl aminopeptidase/acylaminoacyl peptidase
LNTYWRSRWLLCAKFGRKAVPVLVLILVLAGPSLFGQAKKALTFTDMMKFRHLHNPVLSADGLWVAFASQPDRGDGEGLAVHVRTGQTHTVARGARPAISADGRWAAFVVMPKAVDLEKAGRDRPKQGMALVELATGKVHEIAEVDRFAFSEDGKWLAVLLHKKDVKKEDKPEAKPGEKPAPAADAKAPALETGADLLLRRLETGEEVRLAFAMAFAFDKASARLAWAAAHPDGKANGLFLRELGKAGLPEVPVHRAERAAYRNLSWSDAEGRLAFVAGNQDDKGRVRDCSLWRWDARTGKAAEAVAAAAAPSGWIIPAKNALAWSKDGKRLFFGLKPADMEEPPEPEKKDDKEAPVDLFDGDAILAKREVDVWHWNDPLINSHQKKMWNRFKDQTYTAVLHADTGRMVPLADRDMPNVETGDQVRHLLGSSEIPYLKEVTWDGNYRDVFLVGLADGSRKMILTRHGGRPSLSPRGMAVTYYEKGDWFLLDTNNGKSVNLTAELGVPFADEDHDTPGEPRGYGVAGWMADDSAVLIYDKFDIWRFEVPTGRASNLTKGEGRRSRTQFRVVRLDREAPGFARDERLLLSSVNERDKREGFWAGRVGTPGVTKLVEEPRKFTFIAKAKRADTLLYTRQSYEEFPDLWAAGTDLGSPRKLTELNPQIKEFAWGTAELVEWTSAGGVPLQGVLIKPGNYEPGRRYPVIVYFYELFSQRLHEFNQVVVNHRPCFPFYASNGYAVFLPDVRFDIGLPGPSEVKCLVPGAQKLVDMGVADPERIGLHGHSWSGYGTAYVVTQTDLFACAIAGAAVGNMTSAYSGIRYESGVARQMQYEKQQSRIGGSLWEKPWLYWENSPVFFADRVRTPLLLMHGDEDGAVPWTQSVEIYLAMRRLGKDCVFLQYRGEPHHPQKYANKLDYSIKMKEYFDHYLKGAPAPEWLSKGVLYNGK